MASIAPFGTAGVTITETGIWDPDFYCGSVNMEIVFLPTYEYLKQIASIRKKYGRLVRVTTFHEEE